MLPLGILTALAGLGGYFYAKNKYSSQNNEQQNNTEKTTTETEDSIAKNVNTYNYYTNESENGNTLFGSQKKTKRTLFGQ